ncbi:threonylcarbamoyladenosine tRNA methylthiotransferase-like [Pteropus vampyrus]|uniref:Threonylcarbamoyladenosine tRNA methylthiotransferase-like n=1 Tax=Pteropus vampyrus TaxID=132908 RepID=A0A6P6BXL1_PTEVA|nr:threonylcarbamoyladenosine tRNA methylthiotransferase-like [Pteropus vampyrus]
MLRKSLMSVAITKLESSTSSCEFGLHLDGVFEPEDTTCWSRTIWATTIYVGVRPYLSFFLSFYSQIGERQQVLVTEESFDSKFYVAHNRFYEQVLVPKNPIFMGKMVEVDIYESGKHFMKGRPVSDAKVCTPSISKPLAKGEVSGLTEEFRNRLGNHLSSVSHSSAATQRDSASSRMVLQLQRLHQDCALKMSVGLALFALLFAFFVKIYN